MKRNIVGIFVVFILLHCATKVEAVGLSSASATLSNPRLSFHGLVGVTVPSGGSFITIKNSGLVAGDQDTRNLFPNDPVVITGYAAIPVASVSSNLISFSLKTPLSTGAATDTNVTVAESGTLTVTFYTAASIPTNGSIKISIPAPATGGDDGIPISAATVDASGFDTNSMDGTNITCPANFNTATVTTGTGGTPHAITCNNPGSPISAGASITFIVGNTSKGLVNPPPTVGRGAAQRGIADIYDIYASTYDGLAGGGSLIEDVQMKVAPDEGVLVSATIGETLSFSVAGVLANVFDSTCIGVGNTAVSGQGIVVNSTATTIPFGNSILANTFYQAAQKLTVFTNAPGGYTVKVEENDQMGKDGKVCTGATAGEAEDCIKDTDCGVGAGNICTESVSKDWSVNTNSGLGYSMSNVSPATDATFLYSDSTFSARQFPDQEASITKQTIMSNAGIVNGNSACILYRLAVSGTQPAGTYYNNVKYTASAVF